MASRLKEDERNERTIRSLLKLPANKRCINCNSLGPQYVCTNFWTFVCTTCSGIHREFTHRVKSVSMAKFTSQEVAALQTGGNERAKSVYFKDWDSQRHSYPDSSNIDRLRDLIRHAYVDRRFSGEKISEKPPRGEDSYDNRRNDAFRGGSRSPPYEDTYDRRRNDRPSPGGRSDDSYSKYDDRSPGYDRESRYSSDHGRSPTRPEIVNDWRREDRFSNTRKPEDRRTSDGDSLSEGRSPDYQKDVNMPSPPVVRPVRDILGDNVIPLKIDPPKPNGIKAADAPVQRTASSSSFGSYDGNQVEPKRETLGSLIDFDADPEPPAVAASIPQTEQTSSVSTMIQPAGSTSNDNWASFDFATEAKAPQTSSNTLDSLHTHQTSSNTLDSLLTQLTPPSVPAQSGQPQNASNPFFASGGVSKPDVSMGQVPAAPFKAEGFTAASGGAGVAFNDVNASGSWPNMQQPLSFPSGGPHPPSGQQPSNFPAAQLPQSVSNSAHEVVNGFGTQPQKAETKSSGRSALPEDLFAATYHSPLNAPQGWHTNHPVGMGYAMHYNVRAPTHHFQQPSQSSNPFDFGNDSSAAPAPPFSSMASMHGALPTMPQPSTGLLQTSNVGAPSPAYMQHQVPSYTSQAPPYAGGVPPGAYFGKQVAQSIPAIRSQGVAGGIADSSFFGSTNPSQLMARGYAPPASAPAAPNSFPSGGGNPFG
uniref:Arf-GAP domain-containing protein n=1 Tax=Kalanchoe fedtschenkoi TaxID=63787 RepID=A0A7N0RB04_KALFE